MRETSMFHDFFAVAVAQQVKMILFMINALCWQNEGDNMKKYSVRQVVTFGKADIFGMPLDTLTTYVQKNMTPLYGKVEEYNIHRYIFKLIGRGELENTGGTIHISETEFHRYITERRM